MHSYLFLDKPGKHFLDIKKQTKRNEFHYFSLSLLTTQHYLLSTLSLTISFLPISQAKYFGIFPTNIFHNCSNYRLCIEIYYYYDYFYIPELNCLRANMAGKLTKKPNLIPSSQTLSNFGN